MGYTFRKTATTINSYSSNTNNVAASEWHQRRDQPYSNRSRYRYRYRHSHRHRHRHRYRYDCTRTTNQHHFNTTRQHTQRHYTHQALSLSMSVKRISDTTTNQHYSQYDPTQHRPFRHHTNNIDHRHARCSKLNCLCAQLGNLVLAQHTRTSQWAFRGITYNQSTERGDDDSDDVENGYNNAGRCRTHWQIKRCESKVKLIPKRHRHSGCLAAWLVDCMPGWPTDSPNDWHDKLTACIKDKRRRRQAADSILKDELSERKLLAQSNHWTVWMALLRVRMFVRACVCACVGVTGSVAYLHKFFLSYCLSVCDVMLDLLTRIQKKKKKTRAHTLTLAHIHRHLCTACATHL